MLLSYLCSTTSRVTLDTTSLKSISSVYRATPRATSPTMIVMMSVRNVPRRQELDTMDPQHARKETVTVSIPVTNTARLMVEGEMGEEEEEVEGV